MRKRRTSTPHSSSATRRSGPKTARSSSARSVPARACSGFSSNIARNVISLAARASTASTRRLPSGVSLAMFIVFSFLLPAHVADLRDGTSASSRDSLELLLEEHQELGARCRHRGSFPLLVSLHMSFPARDCPRASGRRDGRSPPQSHRNRQGRALRLRARAYVDTIECCCG